MVAQSSKLAAYPTNVYAIADHLATVIDRYATFANAVRATSLPPTAVRVL